MTTRAELEPAVTVPATVAPGRPSRLRSGRVRKGIPAAALRVLVIALLVLLALAVIYPLIWMVLSGFKDNSEVFGNAWGLPGALRWSNFVQAWNPGVVRYLGNSVFVTCASIVTTTLF